MIGTCIRDLFRQDHAKEKAGWACELSRSHPTSEGKSVDSWDLSACRPQPHKEPRPLPRDSGSRNGSGGCPLRLPLACRRSLSRLGPRQSHGPGEPYSAIGADRPIDFGGPAANGRSDRRRRRRERLQGLSRPTGVVQNPQRRLPGRVIQNPQGRLPGR